MGKWLMITVGIIVCSAIIAILFGKARESTNKERLVAKLSQNTSQVIGVVDFKRFLDLPPPVARYFRHVLTDGQKLIKTTKISQSGKLRTSVKTERWSSFTAEHLVAPTAIGFVWTARVNLPFATHVRVLDSYVGGVGSGSVSVLSAVQVAKEAGMPELNSGALHRYLAEAVWYPTALLPEAGIVWRPIDDHSATATLTDNSMTVSLEFQFNEVGEVTGIYTPERFGRFEGKYERKPWEGHFRDYGVQDGMRIPQYGEVGWYDSGALQLVWQGSLLDIHYEFEL